ncbi:TPA: BRO-like protein [Streptococcus suis]|uniref:BRO family protein n=1 Tax=Streptococcus suis TaxID=1307 RepID=UPI000405D683|nr:BRO family protein [Streptococcus suis]HEM3173402.1 BRO-like protein [Streptococcus suis]HEM4054582.1 BRO-like protein [Streptococcus suis]HEM4059905.1 BRO-like protein [Streptococcus suis]
MRRNYSKVIEEMRTTHGLNLVAIGQRIGTDPRTVGKWAQGKHQPNKDSRKKINNLYREVKQDMTTQVSIFEETNENGQVMQVVTTMTFHGQPLNIYGSEQEPYFMARDIAEMIDYQKTAQGKYNTAKMLAMVDEDEKIKGIPNSHTLINNGTTVWFLTEQGLYEVLFQSRKPKAKEFKHWVKNILKEIRVNGYYMQGELIQDQPPQPAIELNSDMAYIKSRLAEMQNMTTMADIKVGLAKTYRIAELMED